MSLNEKHTNVPIKWKDGRYKNGNWKVDSSCEVSHEDITTLCRVWKDDRLSNNTTGRGQELQLHYRREYMQDKKHKKKHDKQHDKQDDKISCKLQAETNHKTHRCWQAETSVK